MWMAMSGINNACNLRWAPLQTSGDNVEVGQKSCRWGLSDDVEECLEYDVSNTFNVF